MLVVEIDVGGITAVVVDKLTCASVDVQPKQVDLRCAHALIELHWHDIHVDPDRNEVDQRFNASSTHSKIFQRQQFHLVEESILIKEEGFGVCEMQIREKENGSVRMDRECSRKLTTKKLSRIVRSKNENVEANFGVITGVSDDLFCVNTSDDDCDVDSHGQSTKGDLNLKYGSL
nr:hypothetical protein [Tanacetum cinerariifolium]